MDSKTPGIGIYIFILFIALTGLQARAQDSLRMRTGAVYSVKIIEITDTQVKYRTYSNPDGPLYNVAKNTIQSMKLEGQRWEFLSPEIAEYRRKSSNPARNNHNNVERSHYIALNLTDLIRTDLTVFYEWMMPGNKIALRVPVTYGFRSAHFNLVQSLGNPFAFARNTVFKAGLDLRIHSGQGYGRVRYVFGPGIYYVRLNRVTSDLYTTDPAYMVFRQTNAMRILFMNGLQITPAEFIQFGFESGVGADIDFGKSASSIPIVPKIQFNLHIGYKF